MRSLEQLRDEVPAGYRIRLPDQQQAANERLLGTLDQLPQELNRFFTARFYYLDRFLDRKRVHDERHEDPGYDFSNCSVSHAELHEMAEEAGVVNDGMLDLLYEHFGVPKTDIIGLRAEGIVVFTPEPEPEVPAFIQEFVQSFAQRLAGATGGPVTIVGNGTVTIVTPIEDQPASQQEEQ